MSGYGERARQARALALENPMLTQSEIARTVGMSRQGVAIALGPLRASLVDGRTTRTYRRSSDIRSASVAAARRKIESQQPLTRDERHLLWQDYRHRQLQAAS